MPGAAGRRVVSDWPELYRRLLADELDVVVAEISHATDDDRFVVEPLPEHPACFFCRAGHPLADRAEVTLEDTARFAVATTIMPRRLLDLLGKNDMILRPNLPEGASTTEFRVETPYVARRIVMESDVLGMGLARQIEHEVALGRLVVLPLHPPWLKTYYGVVRLARRTPSPATSEFLRILREVEDEIE